MTKYVLRPEEILPQTTVRCALLWIGLNQYPDEFINKDNWEFDPMAEYASYGVNLDREWWEETDENPYINPHGLIYTNILSCFTKENDNKIDTATHKLFASFSSSKIKIYGVKPIYYESKELYIEHAKNAEESFRKESSENEFTGSYAEEMISNIKNWANQILLFEYEEIDPAKIKYSDFNWNNETLSFENSTYKKLIVSTDDLFNEYPLVFTQSQKVKFGANNYFINDDDNEIDIKRGRRPILSLTQKDQLLVFAKNLIKNNHKISDKELINKSIYWIFTTFNIRIAFTTMRDYLIPITKKAKIN